MNDTYNEIMKMQISKEEALKIQPHEHTHKPSFNDSVGSLITPKQQSLPQNVQDQSPVKWVIPDLSPVKETDEANKNDYSQELKLNLRGLEQESMKSVITVDDVTPVFDDSSAGPDTLRQLKPESPKIEKD